MTEWLSGIGAGLANHLWQSTACAAVVWVATLLLRKNSARVRYGLWVAASAKFLVPFSLLIALGGILPRPQHAVVTMPVYSAVDEVGLPFSDAETGLVEIPTHAAMRPRHEWGTQVAAGLAGVWVCGVVVVLGIWCGGWRKVGRTLRRAVASSEGREVEILRRVQARVGGRRVRLVLSREWMEPGIFGIVRPVLIWPEGLSARLDDEHIEAIMAHELMHARRRDNLTAALQMLVEAVFWFHPLVWWMERRMVEERERACDEAVVEMGSRPGVYAESLLKAVRFCVESPLVCVAGVTGADLAGRVRSIMTLRLRKLGVVGKVALAALGLGAIGAPILLGQAQAAQRAMLAAIQSAPKPFRAAVRAMIPEIETPSTGEIAELQAGGVAPVKVQVPTVEDGQPNRLHGVYTTWLDQDARWFIAPAERNAFLALTNDQERDDFIQNFWERRGKAAGMSGGAYKAAVYARIAYANEHFASGGPGWSTDRGRIYVVFGKPDEVKVQPGDGMETWVYRYAAGVGDEVTLKFVKMPGAADYRLTSPYPGRNGVQTGLEGTRPEARFEVATIKAMAPMHLLSPAGGMLPPGGGRVAPNGEPIISQQEVRISNAPQFSDHVNRTMNVRMLIGDAYDLQAMSQSRIVGGPDWIGQTLYQMQAKIDDAQYAAMQKMTSAEQVQQVRLMERSMLAERFGLKAHFETREMPVYALKVMKGGPKLTPAKEDTPPANGPAQDHPTVLTVVGKGYGFELKAKEASPGQLIPLLEQQPELGNRPVVDQTGLSGRYDLLLDWTRQLPAADSGAATGDAAPSFFTALKEDLGLELVETRGPVQVLVIDSVERPTEN